MVERKAKTSRSASAGARALVVLEDMRAQNAAIHEEMRAQTKAFSAGLLGLREEMLARFDGGDRRFEGIDGRLDGIDGRLDALESRLGHVEYDVGLVKVAVLEHTRELENAR